MRGLVQRGAQEIGVQIREEVRNATHGSRVWIELRQHLREVNRGELPMPDLLVIIIDGNCEKPTKVRKKVKELAQEGRIPLVVCGVPDPHIERWYLEDPQAWRQVLPGATVAHLRRRCERDYYKNALRETIRQAGVEPSLGGAEYGQDLTAAIDPYRLGQKDRSFRDFWQQLMNAFKQMGCKGVSE